MPYFPNTSDDQRAMLQAIGVGSLDALFEQVPAELRLTRPLNLPAAMGELELTAQLAALAESNAPAGRAACFLGAGAYDHFVPAVVDFVAARSEFYTAYTPYQAEASQGTLQAMFEYQTLITQLTGMGVSNASLYDGATALAEAVLMALQTGGPQRRRVVVHRCVHPEYRQVLATFLRNQSAEVVEAGGYAADATATLPELDSTAACLVLSQPGFFGTVADLGPLVEQARRAGALVIVVFDPISLGVLKRPGELGADIVVAEGQSLGNPLSYGGPYLGILACREPFVRRMPGRLVGQTVDRDGRRCWTLTLQTREQHIRREKATSNICTNQGLLALRAAVYLAALGPKGLRRVAELCLQKAHYARQRLTASGRAELLLDAPVFKEFALRLKGQSVDRFLSAAAARGIYAGVPLGRWFPELSDCLLVAVTEKRTRAEIDALAKLLDDSAG